MTTPYLTPETAEALRNVEEGLISAANNTMHTQGERFGLHMARIALANALDSLPVVGAVPAEEALERLRLLAWSALGHTSSSHSDPDVDAATVRHALRAAQAQADAPKEEAQLPADNDTPGLRAAKAAEEARRTPPDWSVSAKNAKALADMEASFSPPPDVIRRGHEAWDEIGGILRVVLSGFQIGYDEKCAAEALAEARAAMYKLPEEE